MFAQDLLAAAEALLGVCRTKGLTIATAESCTGGLVAGLLTEIAGASDVVDRGFVTYSNMAKSEMLGVENGIIDRHGAVSAAVAVAMADGALQNAGTDLAVAITGIAGPDGGTPQKPVGLVYIAVARKGQTTNAQRFHFAAGSRREVRLASVREALSMLREAAEA